MNIPNIEEPLVPPFKTDGEMKIPLHALCHPKAYMTITDQSNKFQFIVPAVIVHEGKGAMRADEAKTLALTNTLLMLLNKGAESLE